MRVWTPALLSFTLAAVGCIETDEPTPGIDTPTPTAVPTATPLPTPVPSPTPSGTPGPVGEGCQPTPTPPDSYYYREPATQAPPPCPEQRSDPLPFPQDTRQVDLGGSHALLIDTHGRAWAWGANGEGQLGNGSTLSSGAPVRVGALTGVRQVAAGAGFSVAVDGVGRVWTWGTNPSAQLGIGTTDHLAHPDPIQLTGVPAAVAVEVGTHRGLAVGADGSLWQWGREVALSNQGVQDIVPTPTQVTGLSGIVSVAAGGDHTLALDGEGRVYAWGSNLYHQLGDGTTTSRPTPAVVAGLPAAVAVAAYDRYSLALTAEGAVWGWGYSWTGVLLGTTGSASTPRLLTRVAGATSLSAALRHVLVVAPSGVIGWGSNDLGQLAAFDCYLNMEPFSVEPRAEAPVAASASEGSLIVAGDGKVWGLGPTHDVGSEDAPSTPTPAGPVPGLTGVIDLSLGSHFGLALDDAGHLWSWGRNNAAQLADCTRQDRAVPARVEGVEGATEATAGGAHGLLLTSAGSFGWGNNHFGEAGVGDTAVWGSPMPQSTDLVFTHLFAGATHSFGLDGAGRLYGFGNNEEGQLGLGTRDVAAHPAPAALPTSVRFSRVDGGSGASAAVDVDGAVWTWGFNQYGQLGHGGTTSTTSPVQVEGLPPIVDVQMGTYHTVALAEDGSVWAWGYNANGELGDGTRTERHAPVQIAAPDDVVTIAAGGANSAVLTASGEVWVWGAGYSGVLLGNQDAQVVPLKLEGLPVVVELEVGDELLAARTADGVVWTWGGNTYGQLGR